MSQQRSVQLPSESLEVVADDLEEEEKERETKSFLFQYISRRAQRDVDLASRDVDAIEQHTTETVAAGGHDSAISVASRLAEIGDEIDTHYDQEMKEIVALSGTPENAFAIFSDVVKNLFEWDSQGGAKINIGRLSVLMAYCYHLVKTFLTDKMGSGGVILSFMALVATWLFKVLIKAKFYEWLKGQGGWAHLIGSAATRFTGVGRNFYLVTGLACLTIWAISYFRGQ